jgi:hypothetical protein
MIKYQFGGAFYVLKQIVKNVSKIGNGQGCIRHLHFY